MQTVQAPVLELARVASPSPVMVATLVLRGRIASPIAAACAYTSRGAVLVSWVFMAAWAAIRQPRSPWNVGRPCRIGPAWRQFYISRRFPPRFQGGRPVATWAFDRRPLVVSFVVRPT